MGIKLSYIALAICFLILFNSCGKKFCATTTFNFKGSTKAYPDKDSIHINDTIWIELSTPTKLKDLTTGQMVDYSGAANLGTAINFIRLNGGTISNPGSTPAANDFNLVIKEGSPVNNSHLDFVREFLFIEENNLYKFKVGVIPKKLGLYAFGLSNAANVYRNSDQCTKASFEMPFENTNQHLYLLEQSRPGYVVDGLEATNGYYFKVY